MLLDRIPSPESPARSLHSEFDLAQQVIPVWSAEERAAAREQIEELSGLVQAEVEAAEEPAGASARPPIGPVQRHVRVLQGFLDRADAAAELAASQILADAASRLGTHSLRSSLVSNLTVRAERAAAIRRERRVFREQEELRGRNQLVPCRDTDPEPPVNEPLSDTEGESNSEYTVGEDSSSNTEPWDSDDFRDLPDLE